MQGCILPTVATRVKVIINLLHAVCIVIIMQLAVMCVYIFCKEKIFIKINFILGSVCE